MPKIPLANGRGFALVDDEDYKTLSKRPWYLCDPKKGFPYARTTIRREQDSLTIKSKNETVKMHRLIMDAKKGEFVDHIDGNTLNNVRSNLRICSIQQNNMNRKSNHNSKFKFKGIRMTHGKYFVAVIGINGIQIPTNTFATEEDAAKAYDVLSIFYHGDFGRTNFPRELYQTPGFAPVIRSLGQKSARKALGIEEFPFSSQPGFGIRRQRSSLMTAVA